MFAIMDGTIQEVFLFSFTIIVKVPYEISSHMLRSKLSIAAWILCFYLHNIVNFRLMSNIFYIIPEEKALWSNNPRFLLEKHHFSMILSKCTAQLSTAKNRRLKKKKTFLIVLFIVAKIFHLRLKQYKLALEFSLKNCPRNCC